MRTAIALMLAALALVVGWPIGGAIGRHIDQATLEGRYHQAEMNRIAEDLARNDLERDTLALERERAQHQAALSTATTSHAFWTGLGWAFGLLLLVLPVLALVMGWQRFQDRRKLVWPDRDGRLPMPIEHTPVRSDLFEASLAALNAFHQTRALAAANPGTPTTYAPHLTYSNEQHTTAAPGIPGSAPGALEAATPVDLATLQVQLLDRLRPTTGAADLLLGVDVEGREVRGNLHTMMHTLSGGTTGGGKTTLLVGLGLQLAFDPHVALVVADPHLQELALLEDTGALRYPLPTNADQATELLLSLAAEVRQRAELFGLASEQLKDLEGRRIVLNRLDKFNAVCSRLQLDPLPAVVAFGDELRGMVGDNKDGAKAIDCITSEGRKFGIYFVGGSQSWKANVIDTATRSMFWTRYLLPGLTMQQSAALLEMDQREARPIVNSLTAPGVCALWRRGHPTIVVKTPYLDIESAACWEVIQTIAERRRLRQPPSDAEASWEIAGQETPQFATAPDMTEIAAEALQKARENPETPVRDLLDSTHFALLQEEIISRKQQGESQTASIATIFGVKGGRRNAAARRIYQEMCGEDAAPSEPENGIQEGSHEH